MNSSTLYNLFRFSKLIFQRPTCSRVSRKQAILQGGALPVISWFNHLRVSASCAVLLSYRLLFYCLSIFQPSPLGNWRSRFSVHWVLLKDLTNPLRTAVSRFTARLWGSLNCKRRSSLSKLWALWPWWFGRQKFRQLRRGMKKESM